VWTAGRADSEGMAEALVGAGSSVVVTTVKSPAPTPRTALGHRRRVDGRPQRRLGPAGVDEITTIRRVDVLVNNAGWHAYVSRIPHGHNLLGRRAAGLSTDATKSRAVLRRRAVARA